MADQAEMLASRLLRIEWFSKVGCELPVMSMLWSSVRVSNWQEAIAVRGSIDGSNAFNEARNRLSRKVGREFRERFREWSRLLSHFSDIVAESLLPRIDARIRSIPELLDIDAGQEFVRAAVHWDLAVAYLEAVYSDIVEPAVCTSIVDVYEAGHFVCDWDRKWPNGTFWVF